MSQLPPPPGQPPGPYGQPGPPGDQPYGAPGYPPQGPGGPAEWGQQWGPQPGPPGGSNKNALLIVGGVVLLAAFAIGGFVLLSGDDDDSDGDLTSSGGSTTTEPEGDDDDASTSTTEPPDEIDETTTTTESADPIGDGDDLRVEYMNAFVSTLGGEDFLPDEELCFAGAVVDAWGVDTLEATVSPEEIRNDPEAEPKDLGLETDRAWATEVWDTLDGCMDYREWLRRSLDSSPGAEPGYADCVLGNISDGELEDGFIASFSGDDEGAFSETFNDAAADCN